jgi:prophage DNA circulation protein
VTNDELLPATFRGIQWFVNVSGITGGRKGAKRDIVNSDKQDVQDTGLRQRTYTLNGVVAARRRADGEEVISYQDARAALLAVFEQPGPGLLVHPIDGQLDNMQVRSFTLDERITALGRGAVTVTFDLAEVSAAPTVSTNLLTAVVREQEALNAAAAAELAEAFDASPGLLGNFQAGMDKVTDAFAAIERVTDRIQPAIDALDTFANQIAEVGNNIAGLVAAPQALSDAVFNIYQSLANLYTTPQGVFTTMTGLFQYGSDDVEIVPSTAALVQRKRNNDAVSRTVRVMALSYAYLAAAEATYGTVDEVEEVEQILEDEYQSLSSEGHQETGEPEELHELRVTTQAFFDQVKLNTRQVIEVDTTQRSAALLAYAYYGTSELGVTLARLNDLQDPAVIGSRVKVLSA